MRPDPLTRPGLDCYRDNDDTGPAPYRVRINGRLLLNWKGRARKFPTLETAIRYAREVTPTGGEA